MGESTAISWTDHTFNPWWGCARVSPGCQNCYAEAFAKRTGHAVWGDSAERRFFGFAHWNEPLKWDRRAAEAGRPALVFCASMADVFEDRPELDVERERLWSLIDRTPHLIWQLLTKRPQNVRPMVPLSWLDSHWPSTVWIGTTVEDQQRAKERVPVLIDIPARVRFLSCEPLLGEVRLARWLWNVEVGESPRPSGALQWVIAGGESGPRHRPLDLRHARILQRECANAGVPFLFKQVGGRSPTAGGDELDGRTWKQFPAEARREVAA